MATALVIKLDDSKTVFHFRADQDYGADRTAQLATAQQVVAAHETGRTVSTYGLGDCDTIESWMTSGHTKDEITIDGDGNITLPA